MRYGGEFVNCFKSQKGGYNMAYKRVVAALIDLVCSIILFAIVESIFLFLYSKFDISFDFSNIKYFNLIYFSMMSISVIILCVYFFSCDYFSVEIVLGNIL